jgi:acetyl esterase
VTTLPAATQALVDQLQQRFPAPDFTQMTPEIEQTYLSASRAATSQPAVAGEPVAEVVDVSIGQGALPGRVYVPGSGSEPAGVVLYLHGGGWVTGSIEMNDNVCRALANRSSCVVVAAGYRLAPEHRFPAAFDDAVAALAWVVGHAGEHGGDPTRLAVVGSSAGGNLAAAVCLHARDTDGPRIALQVLLYPALDSSMGSRSYRNNATGCFLTAAQMRWCWQQYVPDVAQRRDPYASPAFAADLSGLPPTVIVTAEFDPLRDDGETYAQRLTAARVPTRLYRANAQIHSFLTMLGVVPEAETFLDLVAASVHEHVGTTAS